MFCGISSLLPISYGNTLKSKSEGNCLLACSGTSTSTSMASTIFGSHRAREDDSKSSSSCKTMQPMETNILESIMVASFTFTTLLLLLPCDYIDGSPVPTIIFKGLPSTFHAFVVSLIFAFSGALSALLIHDTSFFAKLCEFSSMASMTSALSLLLWAMSFTFIFQPPPK
ncbi:hypothetical protein LOK49_LG07G02990 [Camellia lanceoleosa]|uniref:Uncharacterized protein n=1 Tax=Camellia lanceoleosa TaxID=1840588 RepID=A0ACC0H5B4_9ERIC|nr:hypothetical protein LOK49_LG07G02990 [Camellia lanceoleosa]